MGIVTLPDGRHYAIAVLVIAKWEGELDRDALHAALDGREGVAVPVAA